MRYFAELSYQGTHYFGWQRQPGQISVQETLEHAFSTILGVPIAMTGCGRTDTGVHAEHQVIHFDSDAQRVESNVTGDPHDHRRRTEYGWRQKEKRTQKAY